MLKEIREMLGWLDEDVQWYLVPQQGFTTVYIDTNDFVGFDEDWDEEWRDVDYTKIYCAKELLKHESIECDCSDMYEWYHFSDCSVCWGATSYDI
jgi:hypothetical protein